MSACSSLRLSIIRPYNEILILFGCSVCPGRIDIHMVPVLWTVPKPVWIICGHKNRNLIWSRVDLIERSSLETTDTMGKTAVSLFSILIRSRMPATTISVVYQLGCNNALLQHLHEVPVVVKVDWLALQLSVILFHWSQTGVIWK